MRYAWILILILCSALNLSAKDNYLIIVDKESLTLRIYHTEGGEPIHTFPVAVGKAFGDKRIMGDMRTPEGVYTVEMIQNPRAWPFDYKDGKGVQYDIYGPVFFRLLTPPHRGIGIHGERDPSLLVDKSDYMMKKGTKRDYSGVSQRRTHGCIVLRNEDLLILKKYVKVGTAIVILPSKADELAMND